jgi:hypothetical protein
MHSTRLSKADELEDDDPQPTPLTHTPDDDARLRPDLIEAASNGDTSARVALCDWPGLTVCGPGAEAALRAWLAALITRNGPYGAEILASSALCQALLGQTAVPSVRKVESAEAALDRLDAAGIGRTRKLEDAEAQDAVTYLSALPRIPSHSSSPSSTQCLQQSQAASIKQLQRRAGLALPSSSSVLTLTRRPRAEVLLSSWKPTGRSDTRNPATSLTTWSARRRSS